MMMHDLGWWYWVLTVGLLGAGLFGWPAGIVLAMALCAVQIGACAVAHAKRHCLPLTGAGRLPGDADRRIVGTVAVDPLDATGRNNVPGCWIGYCLLARTLSLAPWNRWQPLSLALITQTFLSLQAAVPPCGGVFRRMSLERVQG